MSEETLLTAARRLVTYVRVDDSTHGGLLSLDTIKAAELLDVQVRAATKRQAQRDAAKISEKS